MSTEIILAIDFLGRFLGQRRQNHDQCDNSGIGRARFICLVVQLVLYHVLFLFSFLFYCFMVTFLSFICLKTYSLFDEDNEG